MVNETISKVVDENGIQSVYHTKVISVFPHNYTDHSAQQQLSHQKNDADTDQSKEAHSDVIGAATTKSN